MNLDASARLHARRKLNLGRQLDFGLGLTRKPSKLQRTQALGKAILAVKRKRGGACGQ